MRWLPYLNVVLVALLLLVGSLFFFQSSKNYEIPEFLPCINRTELPKSSFTQTEDHDLATGPLALNWAPPLMQLPDLRGELQFFGKNGRPDVVANGKAAYHIGLKSSGICRSIRFDERVYLVYQGNYTNNTLDTSIYREPITTTQTPLWGDVSSSNKGSYVFSPDNQPTPLWLEIVSKEGSVLCLRVNMLDEKGVLVKAPQAHNAITLKLQEFPRSQTTGWELGRHRVDSTLLVRQKARWIGTDRFLELHGGEDFSFSIGKERIDFLDGKNPYSCFIGPDDFLIWKDDRWKTPTPSEATDGFPLLCVKKVDEKILTLELWDPQGRSKTALSLIRAKERNKNLNLTQEFKFVGAKTWAQFIVECRKGGSRLTLKPHDWLVLTQDGWQKLDTTEQIDEYVEGKLIGPLFILDKMIKQNGRQVLVGHLFNTFRTEVEEIELEAASNTSLANFYRSIPQAPPIKPKLQGDEE